MGINHNIYNILKLSLCFIETVFMFYVFVVKLYLLCTFDVFKRKFEVLVGKRVEDRKKEEKTYR